MVAHGHTQRAFATLEEATRKAQRLADLTGSSTLVYESTINPGDFGVEYTVPSFGRRVGERFYPTTSEASGFDNNCQ